MAPPGFALDPGGDDELSCGNRVVADLPCRCPDVRGGPRADRGLGYRNAVPCRLCGRAEPVGRQPVRVRDHHEHVRGARRVSVAGARDRDRAGARFARDLHRGRLDPPRDVLVHVPDLRNRADRDRRPAVPPPRRGSVGRGQRGGRTRAPPAAANRPLRRRPDRHTHRWAPDADAAVRRAGRDRDDRLPVRARLDPRGLRRHHKPVPGAGHERIRAARHAAAVLPRSGPARSARVSVDGTGRDPDVHRVQARVPLRPPPARVDPRDLDRSLARGDRDRARTHDDREPRASP
jgi:hypothetical protein